MLQNIKDTVTEYIVVDGGCDLDIKEGFGVVTTIESKLTEIKEGLTQQFGDDYYIMTDSNFIQV